MFTLLPLVACWRYEPREHLSPLALSRPAIPPSPLRDRVGYSDHDRFRGYFPVHFIPAYNLPVYASQRPLPDATQDSVRGCSLGFAAAVIADGRLQRACKAQPSQDFGMLKDPRGLFHFEMPAKRPHGPRSPLVLRVFSLSGRQAGIGAFLFAAHSSAPSAASRRRIRRRRLPTPTSSTPV